MSEPLTRTEKDLLLRLALGSHTVRCEHRFRHKRTGETRERLDMRETSLAEWQDESRIVVETEWGSRTEWGSQ